MLEPAVRPGGLPGPTQQPHVPIESRNFESLLDEARSMNIDSQQARDATAQSTGSQIAAGKVGLMGQLASVDRIENSSLRHLLKGASVTPSLPNQTDSQANDS